MDLFVKDLPSDTQLLIAMGAAVASGCQPCLKRLVALARDEALDEVQMRAAVTIGQFMKDQPAKEMMKLAKSLLEADVATGDCPCQADRAAEAGCCS